MMACQQIIEHKENEVTRLFTKDFVENVHKAWEDNRKEIHNVYHHPKENGIVNKCIDLSCHKPLHDVRNEPKEKSDSSEKWLEAYIIQLAKRSDNYKATFELAGREYRFLYSQLQFRSMEKHNPRPLDCLLYEPTTNSLVVIELKAERVLKCAVKELDYYAVNVSKIKNELAHVFDDVDGVSTVEGYIVWPGKDNADNNRHNFGRWGLIEYSDKYGMVNNGKLVKPWDQIKKIGQELTMEFRRFKKSEIIK